MVSCVEPPLRIVLPDKLKLLNEDMPPPVTLKVLVEVAKLRPEVAETVLDVKKKEMFPGAYDPSEEVPNPPPPEVEVTYPASLTN